MAVAYCKLRITGYHRYTRDIYMGVCVCVCVCVFLCLSLCWCVYRFVPVHVLKHVDMPNLIHKYMWLCVLYVYITILTIDRFFLSLSVPIDMLSSFFSQFFLSMCICIYPCIDACMYI